MPETRPVVFLLDDEAPIVTALGRVLRAAGFLVRPFTNVAEFLAAHEPETPGCLVTDLRMPGMTGLEVQHALSAGDYTRPIVFVTGHADIRSTVQAMKAGAVTFLPKPVQSAELLAAVIEAISMDEALRGQARERQTLSQRLSSLTPRERQVLDLLATGMLNKQIAAQLGAAEKTIKVHRGRIMEKMHVRTATALVGMLSRAAGARPLGAQRPWPGAASTAGGL
jgi:FixJ family two-component response regulator